MTLPSPITPSTLTNGSVNAASFYFKIWAVINALIAWAKSLTTPVFGPLPLINNCITDFFPTTIPFGASYFKDGYNKVTLRGYVQIPAGGLTGGLSFAVLPVGYRPLKTVGFALAVDSGTIISNRFDIDTNGNMYNGNSSNAPGGLIIYLDGISFYAGV